MKIKVRQRYGAINLIPFYEIYGDGHYYVFFPDISEPDAFDQKVTYAQASFRLTQAQQAI